jgi:uncharacterized protein (DUF1501 family)
MNRRSFIKSLVGTAAAAGGSLLLAPATARAQTGATNPPALVVIFQRGGCDGLNTVVPYADPDYYNLRPTIAIPEPSPADPFSALDLNGFFGLHPSLAPLLPLYQSNQLALLPTVQYPGYSRSHFDSQHFIESGVRADDRDGWLNRHLAGSAGAGMRAVHFGGELAQSLRGAVPVPSFSSIGSFNLGLADADEQALVARVLPVYNQAVDPADAYRSLVYRFGRLLFGTLDLAAGIDTGAYVPANNAQYPAGGFGGRLREIAQLLKDPGLDLELATVDIGGWDTHSDQGAGEPDGRQARSHAELAQGIAALTTDLGGLMDNVVILCMTEFGRTCKENGSRGTDHGVASTWMLAGGPVQGGIYTDRQGIITADGRYDSFGWPELREDSMIDGRFLDWTIDYRDIMADILTDHLGSTDLGTVLPGHTHDPIGLIRGGAAAV